MKVQAVGKPKRLSPSEALFGFGGWLTTREESVTMSSKDDAGIVARLIDEFCKTNNLDEPREHWEENLIHPKKIIANGRPSKLVESIL